MTSDRELFPTSGDVTAADRARVLGHGAATVWFTGLSGSGKSTLATAIERTLIDRGAAAYRLDGDRLRTGLNADLGFEPADRAENIRRAGEVAALLNDAGLIVISAFISPYRADRDGVRQRHEGGRFLEVHIATPIEVCEQRDVKGLYARARRGELPGFTGISAPYEPPEDPDLTIDTSVTPIPDGVTTVVAALEELGALPRRGDGSGGQ